MIERLEAGPTVCVGLDPHPSQLPAEVLDRADGLARWSREVIDAVAPHVSCIKPQVALYEQHGAGGWQALEQLCAHARTRGVPILLDAKRGDIGSTAEAYAHALLDDDGPIGADALTVSPYLGPESLGPFLKRVERGKMLFLLLRTSNPGAEVWQRPVLERIASWVASQNARLDSPRIGVVVGATVPDEVRALLPHAWFLTPGIGAQGAAPTDVIRHLRPDGLGVLPTASRSVLFGDHPKPGIEGIHARANAFAASWKACYQDR